MLSIAESYDAIRNQAAVIERPGAAVIRVTGPDRAAVVGRLLARATEFVAVDSCVDSLLLGPDGQVKGLATALIGTETIWLVSDAEADWIDLLSDAAEGLEAVAEVAPELRALHVEGPRSWQVAGDYTGDTPIEDLLLGELVTTRADGEQILVARSGSTAEFGYLLVLPEGGLRDEVVAAAERLGGGLIDPEVLPLVHIETNHPVLPQQTRDCTVLEAGLGWFISFDRSDGFIGDQVCQLPAPHRRVVAAQLDGEPPSLDAEVRDGDVVVGRVQVVAPRADRPQSLVLLLLEDPYGVPGLDLTVDGRPAHTLSRPVIRPRSWTMSIGDESA